jgi:Co/Zn/Cd efflux system component
VAPPILGKSLIRLRAPIAIHFDEAVAVAAAGPIVNLVCALLLAGPQRIHEHSHEHDE